MHDVVVISDLHLGADICQAKSLKQFLKEIKTRVLILNGDIFDTLDFRRMRKAHWKILGLLRKISLTTHVIWIKGNHEDCSLKSLHNLLGIEFVEEYCIDGILFLHDDRFDNFLTEHPILTWIGDTIYWLLQKIDRSFKLVIRAKHSSKEFLHNAEVIEKQAKIYAKAKGFSAVVLGHSHFAVDKPGEIAYYNSGSWTEPDCTYITINQKKIELCHFSS